MKNWLRFGLLTLLLVGCGSDSEQPTEEVVTETVLPQVSGAKAGAVSIGLLNNERGTRLGVRPSETLGIFASTYLSQGAFLPVQSAMQAIDAHGKILEGQTEVQTDENFALLKEYAAILQVDIVDLLNRSEDRAETLDTYMNTMANLTKLAKRKENELQTLLEELEDQRREKRTEERDIERLVNRALRDEDYETAAANQEALTKARADVAAIESKEDQTKDIKERFQKLIKIAEERLIAIAQNKRVILAGLKVVEVPGIEDFDILDDDKSKRQSREESLDPFGLLKNGL